MSIMSALFSNIPPLLRFQWPHVRQTASPECFSIPKRRELVCEPQGLRPHKTGRIQNPVDIGNAMWKCWIPSKSTANTTAFTYFYLLSIQLNTRFYFIHFTLFVPKQAGDLQILSLSTVDLVTYICKGWISRAHKHKQQIHRRCKLLFHARSQ